ncbi:Na+/H+ antiporter subunit E [Ferrimonas pelagia]|uniref:Na+/H+ antiporter subunit E n=1 Tax=Ferrimonas pelagia TaxID=1177826 RepID=A0ABP9FJ51_9GAMM
MRYTLSLLVCLTLIWLLNSGHYTSFISTLGVASIAFVAWLAHRMELVDNESYPLHLARKFPGFICWLLKELVLSNWQVIKLIIKGPKGLAPAVAILKHQQDDDASRVVLANSVTLTPGTLSLDLDETTLTVHALHHDDIDALQQGSMIPRVKELGQ